MFFGNPFHTQGTPMSAVRFQFILLVWGAAGFLGTLGFGNPPEGGLPILEGTILVDGLRQEVLIDRDDLGIPTIHAQDLEDLSRSIGFLHAQDRFFQMDLFRRVAAGELAALNGARPEAVLANDLTNRVFRLRHRAEQVVLRSTAEQQRILRAYTEGVNAGLAALSQPPFEYRILGITPEPWRDADSILVSLTMFLQLQNKAFDIESTNGLLRDTLPLPLAEFLSPRGCEWDAPIRGEAIPVPDIPTAETVDLRSVLGQSSGVLPRDRKRFGSIEDADRGVEGSNNWAVAGSLTKHGGAIVANDMHLGIRVPNTWYRARCVWIDESDPAANGKDVDESAARPAKHQVTGVTLPGAPAIVVGSTGHIAWGFTNSEGDWSDLVLLETDPENPDRYRTPEGYRNVERFRESIAIRGGPPREFVVEETIWGPVVGVDHRGRRQALRWVALDPEGVNLLVMNLYRARNIDEALAVANQCGMPAQNFVVADTTGRIGWTILGRIPRRVGMDGFLPESWAQGDKGWNGWLLPEEYPRVVDPENGRIWTANSRVVEGEMLQKIGYGDYDHGARAKQIRDGLLERDKMDESDMLAIQLDHRALFLERWQKLLLKTLNPESLVDRPDRQEMRHFVEHWGASADIDSVGFRLVRKFRIVLSNRILESLTRPCQMASSKFSLLHLQRSVEGSVWKLLEAEPEHLLDPEFGTWQELRLWAVDETRREETKSGESLADQTCSSRK